MNILKKLTTKNLLLNKKRSIGTTIGIILSVALICAVGGLFTSFHETIIQDSIDSSGYYHLSFDLLNESEVESIRNHKNVLNVDTMYRLGVSKFDHEYEESDPYVKVYSIDPNSFNNLKFEVTNGSFPMNSNEVIVNQKMLEDAELKIGDEIELDIGMRKSGDFRLYESNPYNEENKEYIDKPKHRKYKIVGVYAKSGWNYSYQALTVDEKSDEIRTFVALNNPRKYKDTARDLLGVNTYDEISKLGKEASHFYSTNRDLIRWQTFSFSDETLAALLTICTVVVGIIIFTSVFCIRNSFAISTLEKMKMYGMLSSVGATKKQIKKSVTMEGMMLGIIGVPIGILGGIFAVFVLVKIVNFLSKDFLFNSSSAGVIFKISIIPILIAVVLGFLVIYLSSISSSRRASKVSPIDSLRSTNEIKITSKKLHTPKIISKLFGTGGVLAYKNLKRSKKKYRTTVISLTVSIMSFISLNSFINEGFVASTDYYRDYKYNIQVYANEPLEEKLISEIKSVEGIRKSYVFYDVNDTLLIKDLSHVNEYSDDNAVYTNGISMSLVAFDDETFKEYVKSVGLTYDEVKDKGIIYNLYRYYNDDGKTVEKERYSYKKGDVVKSKRTNNTDFKFTVGGTTTTPPIGLEDSYYSGGYVIFDKDYVTEIPFITENILIDAEDASKVAKSLKEIEGNFNFTNLDEQVKAMRSVTIIISIFLYGFIAVITLIGVTNIFNTITANMELRSKEFAILKSIGMTKHEFNRMVNLETLFYSTKSLIFGTVLGLLGGYLIHMGFNETVERSYVIPYKAILIAVVFVFLIVFLIMKYSISKINKQNTIETIRNENI